MHRKEKTLGRQRHWQTKRPRLHVARTRSGAAFGVLAPWLTATRRCKYSFCCRKQLAYYHQVQTRAVLEIEAKLASRFRLVSAAARPRRSSAAWPWSEGGRRLRWAVLARRLSFTSEATSSQMDNTDYSLFGCAHNPSGWRMGGLVGEDGGAWGLARADNRVPILAEPKTNQRCGSSRPPVWRRAV